MQDFLKYTSIIISAISLLEADELAAGYATRSFHIGCSLIPKPNWAGPVWAPGPNSPQAPVRTEPLRAPDSKVTMGPSHSGHGP